MKIKPIRRAIPVLASMLILIQAVTALAEVQYVVTDLGTLGSGTMSEAMGINNSNQVVGYSYIGNTGKTRAFIYSNNTMTDLGVTAPGFVYAKSINDSGTVVGFNGNGRLFVYSGGTPTNIDMYPGGWGNQFGFSDFGISSSGIVVGSYGISLQQAASYSNGVVTPLPFSPFPPFRAGASAINDNGDIVGTANTNFNPQVTHAFLYSGETMIDLGTLGGTYSEAESINNAGQITGTTTAPDASLHGFLYTPGVVPTWTDLGDHLPNGMNNIGQVVGSSAPFNGHNPAFLYSGGTVADLNTLIDPASGWELFNAYDINDSGVIVGSGVKSSFLPGQIHAFMAVPMPEPPCVGTVMLCTALVTRRKVR